MNSCPDVYFLKKEGGNPSYEGGKVKIQFKMKLSRLLSAFKRDNIINICENWHLYAFFMLTETGREGGKEIVKPLLFFSVHQKQRLSRALLLEGKKIWSRKSFILVRVLMNL